MRSWVESCNVLGLLEAHPGVCLCISALEEPTRGLAGGPEKVNSQRVFVTHKQPYIPIYIHTHTQRPLKEAPGRHNDAFVRATFPMSACSSTQIDHLSIALCMKGKCMHAAE